MNSIDFFYIYKILSTSNKHLNSLKKINSLIKQCENISEYVFLMRLILLNGTLNNLNKTLAISSEFEIRRSTSYDNNKKQFITINSLNF